MKVAKDTVVSLAYKLTDQNGSTLDESDANAPLAYLHGYQNIIPGLESELTGRSKGDSLKVNVPADKAYGDRNDELVHVVSRKQFEDADSLSVGMQFEAPVGKDVMMFTITAIEKDEITVDGNHPLAGLDLNFAVDIVDVRQATKEEIAHGHVHGPGGEHP